MIINEDIETDSGVLLVKKGQSVSHTIMVRLSNHLKSNTIKDEIFVTFMR